MLSFGEEYFDGGSPWGYGSYTYDGRFAGVVEKLISHYGLNSSSHVLDLGCAKGYILYEFYKKGITNVHGLDISDYAIAHVPEELRGRCFVGSADDLSRWKNKSIDFILSKDVIHNLEPARADRSISEVARVSKGAGFLQISSYRNPTELECLKAWVITIKTVRSADEWLKSFEKAGYRGDYHFLCHSYALEKEDGQARSSKGLS